MDMRKRFDAARADAQAHYADPSNDDIEIADDATVTLAGESGFWVEARVFVWRKDVSGRR
jgi:hypothetical protein